MSTILNTNGVNLEIPKVDISVDGNFYIVWAEWNREITEALKEGAEQVLKKAGVPDNQIVSVKVPGTVELVNAAALLVEHHDPAAVIIIGCVIRGDTPHFDYVCHIAAEGTARLNALGKAPVIFGVLTVENLQQAQERAGGVLGNKGAEAAVAAIEMANLHNNL